MGSTSYLRDQEEPAGYRERAVSGQEACLVVNSAVRRQWIGEGSGPASLFSFILAHLAYRTAHGLDAIAFDSGVLTGLAGASAIHTSGRRSRFVADRARRATYLRPVFGTIVRPGEPQTTRHSRRRRPAGIRHFGCDPWGSLRGDLEVRRLRNAIPRRLRRGGPARLNDGPIFGLISLPVPYAMALRCIFAAEAKG